MNEYFYPGYLIDTTNPNGGAWVMAWQHVKDGAQVAFVDASNPPLEIKPSDSHEFVITSAEPHFAPGVLRDPAEGYTPPTISEYLAAVKAGTVDKLVERSAAAAAVVKAVDLLSTPEGAVQVAVAPAPATLTPATPAGS